MREDSDQTNVERIPLVDLQALHQPLQDELAAAAGRVLRSGRYILGPEGMAFERELVTALGVAAAIGCSSGTDALVALLMAVGVGAGDEVVTTPYSFFASCEAIVRLGARPVFADVDPETLTLDARAAAGRMSPRTRAVLVVHLFGRPATLDPLRATCAERSVPLLEDAAQAIGARSVGLGTAATLSFFPSKNLGGFGDGGAVLTHDLALADKLRWIRNHGTVADKMRHEQLGGNFRLDELQAALLRVKLPWLPRWTEGRRRIARAYHARLAGLPVALPPQDDASVWNQFVIRVPPDRRDSLRAHLQARGIATAVYYPIPLHLQPALSYLRHRPGEFPNAERAARDSVALPICPTLTDAALDRVAGALAAFFR
jgi:dTDP-4-amino-4,6-dideoxygalactose transaminase